MSAWLVFGGRLGTSKFRYDLRQLVACSNAFVESAPVINWKLGAKPLIAS